MSHAHGTSATTRRRTHPPVPAEHVHHDVTHAVLTLEDRGVRYVVLQSQLEEVVRPNAQPLRERIERLQGHDLFRLRGEMLPVTSLARRLQGEPVAADPTHEPRLIILRTACGRFGLVVDAIVDHEELAILPLPPRLQGLPLAFGAAVRADGRIAIALEVTALAEGLARRDADTTTTGAATREVEVPQMRMMLVRMRPGRMAAIPVDEVAHIARFASRALERRGDLELARDAQGALPVFTLAQVTAPEDDWRPEDPDRAHPVLVHVHEGRRIGYRVEAVEDIVRIPRDGHDNGVLVGGVIHERRSLATLAPRLVREVA